MERLQPADTASHERLRAAAEGLQPEAVNLVLRLHAVTTLDQVPEGKVDAVSRDLQVCSRAWPPPPLTSPLDPV